jgi:Protein of unknown function (DUF2971)
MAFLEYAPSSLLYHYTSEEGLKGIVGSGQLWLSDLSTSNDPRDIHLGIETVRRIVEGILSEPSLSWKFFDVSKLTDNVIKYFNHSRCYTVCFTSHQDNISMWREYADAGRGFVIGFRPRAISDMHGRIYRVRYIDETSDDQIRSAILDVLDARLYSSNDDVFRAVSISTGLISIVASIKHNTWSYENEVRLTLAASDEPHPEGIPLSQYPDDTPFDWRASQARPRGNEEIRYHSLPFGRFSDGRNDPSSAISEIVVGPNSSWSDGDVRQLLETHGFSKFKILRSVCAFR